MSAVPYKAIRDKIESIINDEIDNDGDLEGCRVYVEAEPQLGLSDTRTAIAVFLDRRSAAAVEQVAAAGRRTRYALTCTLWVLAFDMEDYRRACDKRDEVLGILELLLMQNRDLSTDGVSLIDHMELEGGELFSARDARDSVFTAVAELVLTLEVSAIVE